MRNHDRFINQMVALGGCLRFFLRHCKAECGDGARCKRGIEIAANYTKTFEKMSALRRWLFNIAVRLLVR